MKLVKYILILLLFASPVWATDYYVRDDGSDSNTGLSHAQAWQTITKVNNTISTTSDRVFFRTGDTWSNVTLTVDWATATVGAYHWDDPDHLIGTDIPSDAVLPIIEGTYPTYVDANKNTDGYPVSNQSAMIVVNAFAGTSTIQDLHIQNSAGAGIRAYNLTVNIYRCEMEDITSSAIYLYQATAGTIESNDLERVAMGYNSQCGITTTTRPPCVSFTQSANITARYNTIKNSCGEGFQTNTWANNIIYDSNYLQDMRCGFNLYANAGTKTHTITVKNNIVIGTSDHTYHTWGGTFMGPGVLFNDLNRNSVHSIYVYNNLVAGDVDSLVRIKHGTDSMYNIFVYANTAAGTQYGMVVNSASVFTGDNEIKNNIFTDINSTLYDGTTEANLDWDYNHWDSTPAAGAVGSNDQTGDPSMPTSVWNNAQGLDVSDFVPAQGSSAVNNGVAVSGYNYRIAPTSSIPDSVSNVTSYTGAGWDMGAIEYTGVDVTVISNGSPSGTVASTTTVNLEADTDRNATLKFDTSDVAYGSMGTTFNSTGGTDDHLHTLTGLTSGAYTYYVRAADSTSSYVISFSIDPDSTNLITTNTITDYTADTLAGYEYHNICDSSTEVGPNNTSGVQAQAYYVEADLGAEYDITESSLFGDTLKHLDMQHLAIPMEASPRR
jgi:hypothetical protein